MLQVENLSKIYQTDDIETHALSNVSFEISDGEFVSIMGPSGCGKSTLLGILGLLDAPSSGTYRFFGTDVTRCSGAQLTKLRKSGVGFIFQGFNLIDDLTVSQNVEVPLTYTRMSRRQRLDRVHEVLARVNLTHRAKHFPQQLSGGQQQRVAVARALVAEPRLIMADEPTGNLDTENGIEVMKLLTQINSNGTTVVMVTHSLLHAELAKRQIRLLDGRLVSQAQFVA